MTLLWLSSVTTQPPDSTATWPLSIRRVATQSLFIVTQARRGSRKRSRYLQILWKLPDFQDQATTSTPATWPKDSNQSQCSAQLPQGHLVTKAALNGPLGSRRQDQERTSRRVTSDTSLCRQSSYTTEASTNKLVAFTTRNQYK